MIRNILVIFFNLVLLTPCFSYANEIDSTLQKTFSQFMESFQQREFLEDCKVQTYYVALDGYWGSVETERKEPEAKAQCNYEIKIAENLRGKAESNIVLIHELSHVVRDFHQPQEERWVNEGLAQVLETEYIGLWPTDKQEYLFGLDRIFLSSNDSDYTPKGAGYSTSYFFMKYLFNRFGGKTLMKKILISKKFGWNNIESSVQAVNSELKLGIPQKFLTRRSLWTHFSFAVLLNNPHFSDYGLFLLDYKFKGPLNLSSEGLILLTASEALFPKSNFISESFFLRTSFNSISKSLIEWQSDGYHVYCYRQSPHFHIEKMTPDSIQGIEFESCRSQSGNYLLLIK